MTACPLPPLLLRGDCIARMRDLPDASIDAIVTDPPYGLEFMGKDWDSFATGRAANYSRGGALTNTEFKGFGTLPSYTNRPAKRCGACGKQAWSGSPCTCETPQWVMDNSVLHTFQAFTEAWAAEALRVLKPGGHLLAFGGSRTWHRLAAGIEDAGFEIRDSIAWLYGSGFPKSLDVSKAIDKAAGAVREIVGTAKGGAAMNVGGDNARPWHERQAERGGEYDVTAPATAEAAAWQGWGTALKPAFEPVVVARKPLVGTVAANVLQYGTGALNIDASRIGHASEADRTESEAKNRHATFGSGPRENQVYGKDERPRGESGDYSGAAGRWPANVMLDESQAAALDAQTGVTKSPSGPVKQGRRREGSGWDRPVNARTEGEGVGYGDVGGASRFFYVAKAPKSERPVTVDADGKRVAHPTVKPLALMRYLCKLVTPPGGVVLDPFAGSGTTLEAAHLEGFEAIGVELTPDYWPLIEARIERAVAARQKGAPMYHAEPMSEQAAEAARAMTTPRPIVNPAQATSEDFLRLLVEADATRRELDAVRRLLWIVANRSKHGALRFADDELAAVPDLPGVSVIPSPGGFTLVAHRDGDAGPTP